MVQITVDLPPAMPDDGRAAVKAAELARGRELVSGGVIKSIWRIPGGIKNVGIWEAADATALHAYLESLPMFRWCSTQVTALARHPLSEEHRS
jgi:muconolactone D-isomerase